MCVMHAPINRKSINVSNRDRSKKERTAFNEDLLKPDPSFKDERKTVNQKPQRTGFFAKLLQ